MSLRLDVVVPGRDELGESPVWDDRSDTLWWVDIHGKKVHRWSSRSGARETRRFRDPVGAVALREAGGVVLAAGMSCLELADLGGTPTEVAQVGMGARMNDGAVDAAGRFWIGTLAADASPGSAALYLVDLGGPFPTVAERLVGVTISNGIDWSPDGSTMYYIDTVLERVEAFDFTLGSGTIRARRTVVDLSSANGRPDGLCVDANGDLWVAMARGGAVRCHAPSGELRLELDVPAPAVTSLAFGGPGLDTLFITTGRWSGTAARLRDQPMAGSVFALTGTGAVGRPVHRVRTASAPRLAPVP
ncbi:SMP-30/gluconolactonase/LRE family protein [Monashia sp. NPDC004114]